MKTAKQIRPIYWLSLFILVALACNLSTSGTAQPAANTLIPNAPPAGPLPVSATDTPGVVPVSHVLTPPDAQQGGGLNYDVDSSGTAPEHRAPYGDSYDLNLFERPFTQQDMTYLPNVDITTFQLTSDGTWNYVFINLIGSNPNDPVSTYYGVEINKNHDGYGDTLVWAQPPYTTAWSTNGVKAYTDPNHDTGGASPERSDAKPGVPYPGDGYENVIFDQGHGADPDLAWVRIDPQNPSLVEFAFKQSLSGPSFMYGVWADAGLKDPSKFNYNDHFTLVEAGSSLKADPNYPLKAIYAVDNTCWVAVGFKPTGFEPHLCPPASSTVKPTQVPGLHGVPVLACPSNPLPICGKEPPGCPCSPGKP